MRRLLVKSYIAIAASFVLAVGAWWVLNKFRVHYYNDAYDGPGRGEASPYWAIVNAQEVLEFPIKATAGLLLLCGAYESIHAMWIGFARKQKSGPR